MCDNAEVANVLELQWGPYGLCRVRRRGRRNITVVNSLSARFRRGASPKKRRPRVRPSFSMLLPHCRGGGFDAGLDSVRGGGGGGGFERVVSTRGGGDVFCV